MVIIISKDRPMSKDGWARLDMKGDEPSYQDVLTRPAEVEELIQKYGRRHEVEAAWIMVADSDNWVYGVFVRFAEGIEKFKRRR